MSPAPNEQQLGESIAKGAMIMVALRWASRLMGLSSTIALARFLAPEDFGLIAVALALRALLEMLFETSTETSLITRRSRDPGDWDTAWALRVSVGFATGLVMIAAGFWAAHLYAEPRHVIVFAAIGLAAMIGGFENIGLIEFRLDMKFDRDATFQLVSRLFGIAATVASAYAIRDYRAILLSTLIAPAFRVFWSYRIHPYRPSFRLTYWRRFVGFSSWMLLLSLARYSVMSLDRIFLARAIDARALGHYKMAGDLAELPVAEVVFPISRALGVGFSSLRHDPPALRRLLASTVGIAIAAAVPVSIGLMLVANEFVQVVLGPSWHEAVPFFRLLLVYFMCHSIVHYCGTALIATDRVPPYAIAMCANGLLLFAIAAWLSRSTDIATSFAVARGIVGVTIVGSVVAIARSYDLIGLRVFSGMLWRPAIAAAIMATGLQLLPPIQPPIVALASKVILGASLYAASLLATWKLAGSPAGPESQLVELAQQFLSRRR